MAIAIKIHNPAVQTNIAPTPIIYFLLDSKDSIVI